MKKRIVCLVLAFMMVVCFMPNLQTTVMADEGTYTITVKAAPSTVNLTFKDSEGKSVEAVDGGVVSKYHQYTLSLTSGTYSYVGTDGDYNLGGDTFTVSKGVTLVLVRNNVRYNGAALSEDEDYNFTIKNGDKEINYGTPYKTSNIKYTPTLLIAGTEYKGNVSIADKWNEEYYLTSEGNFTVNLKNTVTTAQTFNLPITAYKLLRVTAPSDATVKFFKQEANYVVTDRTSEITATKDNGNGTKTYEIKGTAAHSDYQYRATKSGEVTEAGYLTDGTPVVIDFSTGKNADTVKSELTTDCDDNGVLLNIDDSKDTNELALGVGETFKLRAWRAAWEIINTSTGNRMIEPDMHYQVLTGSENIEIAETNISSKGETYVSGNADGNWMNVTGKKEGSAIVAVWYDAINITGANPGGFFGAADPARYGVFVANVGKDTTVEWNPVSSDGDWDSEFDTVYYTDENGFFTIKPEGVDSIAVQNVYGKTLGEVQTVLPENDGSYKVPVKTGANVITAVTSEGEDYFVVRAKQISYTIKNNTTGDVQTNEAPAIKTGDSVTIRLNGLDMPVPKMSGIYNPGYMGTAKILYKLNDSAVLLSTGTQYDFAHSDNGCAITFNAYMAGTNTLKGYISLSSMGDAFGNHRNTTDEGRAANMSASEVFGQFGILPDISYVVTDDGTRPSYDDVTELESLSILGGVSTYMNAFNFTNLNAAGKVSSKIEKIATTATWSKDTSAMSTYTLQVKATAKSYMNSIQIKYWVDGEEVHTANLTSGVMSVIPNPGFDSSKDFHIEIIVSPRNALQGVPKVYSYTVTAKGAKSAVVSYSMQKDGAYIAAPKENINVGSNKAETFGYTDGISSSTGVSVLDVLVQAHLDKYGNSFTKETASDYLVVGEGGYVTKLFGVDTTANGFMLNQGYPNDGTESTYGGYNGTTVTTQTVVKGDRLDFYTYSDTTAWSDQYTFLEIPEEISTNTSFDVKVLGLGLMSGYLYKTPADFKEAAVSDGVQGMRLAWVDKENGTVTPIANVTANAEGKASVKAPSSAGEYYLTALSAANGTVFAIMNPANITVKANTSESQQIKDLVSIRIIGASEASKDVDYGTNPVTCDSVYQNWVVTTNYSLSEDEIKTVGDLLEKACDDNGLRAVGIDSGYVSSISAPSVLGGKALGEFDNGAFSGWMYTVNGKHPNVGLDKYKLKTGDKVIWHYVNDYRYEVSDWYDGSLGNKSQQNLWLKAADRAPKASDASAVSAGGAAPATAEIVKTENKTDSLGNKSVITTDATGKQAATVTVSEQAAREAVLKGTAIVLPVPEVKATETKERATTVKVELPKGTEKAKVSIAVKEATNTTVLMKKNEDGTYSPVPTSVLSTDGKGIEANIVNGDYIVADNKVEFKDVREGSWFEKGAEFAGSRGLMIGIGEGNFGAAGQLTAAQTAAVIGRLQGENATESWNKAVANNSNSEAISRQATMKMLYDAYKTMGKIEAVKSETLALFKDAGDVEAVNLEAMQWAVSIGMLNGVGDNTLDPTGSLTRAQYATILERFVNLLSK